MSTPPADTPVGWRANVVPGSLIAIILALAGGLIVHSLNRPAVPFFIPTVASPAEAGDALVGPVTYTVDASKEAGWTFFDFSRGSIVERPGPLDWDLAFQRFHIIANGGTGFAGAGGVVRLGTDDFEGVSTLPATGYVETVARRDSANAAIARWYEYNWTSHILSPTPDVYGVQTADGRYAKLQVLGYYCPGAVPGCLTFRYVYQGSGGLGFSESGEHVPATATEPEHPTGSGG